MTEELTKYLSIIQNLGFNHLKTMNGFVQKPIGGSYGSVSILPGNGNNDMKSQNSKEMLYHVSQVLDRMDTNQFDDVVYYLTKQLREPLDNEDKNSLIQISNQLKTPLDYLESIGRIYQSYLLFELLTLYCTEEQLSKISDSLTSVFPVPLDSTEDQEVLSSAQTISKTQNYLLILQKLQQLFAKTPIDSLLHLQQQGTEFLTPQQICDTLDMKSEEYYLATSLKVLLASDELTLTSLVDSFPKFQSLQLIQLSLLPFKNIYEILDLKSNLCSLSSIYQVYPQQQQPAALQCKYQVPDPEKKIELKIVDQPPEKAVYRRNVKPYPSVMFDGDSKLLNGNYYVNITLLRCNDFKDEPTFLSGNKLTQVGSSRIVSFRKLKILVTSHQQGETLFCFRFDLRRYNTDPEQNPKDFELVTSIHSNPICILSHSTQLKHTFSADLPKVVEIVPIDGPCVGGTKVALLGANFADTPGIRIKFDNTEVIPEYHSQGTLTCYAPEHPAGTVQVRVSNSPKVWSSTTVNFTYQDNKELQIPNNLEMNPLQLPKSVFGLDFSTSFTNFIIKDASMLNLPSNPQVFRGTSGYGGHKGGNQYNLNILDNRGYGLIHYSIYQDDQKSLFNQIIANPTANLTLRDKHGNTPLHYAIMLNDQHCIKSLIMNQNQRNMINIQNNLGQTPLHLLLLSQIILSCLELLPLFIRLGANLSLEDINGATALHYASVSGNHHVVDYLLKNGSDLYSVDYESDSSLHYAVRENNVSVIQVLLKYSQISQSQLNSSQLPNYFNDKISINNLEKEDQDMDEDMDEDEQLPLHLIKNDDNETPLHLAMAINSHPNILNLLINFVDNNNSSNNNNSNNENINSNNRIQENIKFIQNQSSSTNSKFLSQFLNSIQKNTSNNLQSPIQQQQLSF